MHPSNMDLDEDENHPFASEELLDLEALMQKMSMKGIMARKSKKEGTQTAE